MSTTIKPLDIYIGGNKVFPDVNLDILQYSDSLLFESILDTIDNINTQKHCNLDQISNPYILSGTDDSSWHTGGIYNGESYWKFNSNAYDIDMTLDLAWLKNTAACESPFYDVKTPILNFKGTLTPMQGYTNNDWGNNPTLVYSQFWCKSMFSNAHNLKEIHNLNFDQSPTYLYDSTYFDNNNHMEGHAGGGWGPFYETYLDMFGGCNNLEVLEAQWPTVFKSNKFISMFHGCSKLPDNQFPTIDMQPIDTNKTIKIDSMFKDCTKLTSLHITSASWAYISSANKAWFGTDMHTIDIPASATNLINVESILGDLYWPEEVEGHRDFSGWKYIIRTTAPMTAELNESEGANSMLFNYWDYDSNSDFMNTFGGIYVPDAQLQDWKDTITNKYSGPNVAANHVHGLSDL